MPRLRLKWVIIVMMLLVAARVFLRTGALRHIREQERRAAARLEPSPTALSPESAPTQRAEPTPVHAAKRIPPIAGDVYDEQTGAPISGALVELLADATFDEARQMLELKALDSTVSDADGKYSFDTAQGRYFLRASAKGYPRRQCVTFSVLPSSMRPLRRIPLRASGQLEVSVLSESGRPASGVAVEVRASTSGWSFVGIANSGPDGHAHLEVPWDVGAWALARGPSGVQSPSSRVTVAAGTAATIELRLPDSIDLHGRVVDELGHALPGVRVAAGPMSDRARSRSPGSNSNASRTTSGADGTFLIGVPDTPQKLYFHLDGYERGELSVEQPSSAGPLSIAMVPGATITGQVVSAVTSAPLPGARIKQNGGVDPVITDSDGRYKLILRTPRDASLVAAADGYLTSRRKLEGIQGQESRAGVDFRLSAAPLVRGVVLDDLNHTGIAGADVSFQSEGGIDSTVSDATGHFEFYAQGLEGSLTVNAQGFGAATLDYRIASAGTPDELEIQLKPVGLISGHVYTKDKRPVPGATVELFADSRSILAAARAGADGAYALNSVPSSHDYTIRARHPELGAGFAAGPPLQAGARITGIDVTIEKTGAVSGVVVNEQGDGIVGQSVSLRPSKLDLANLRRSFLLEPEPRVTGSEGKFEITEVAAASYIAVVDGGRGYVGVEEPLQVRAGETTEIRIKLTKGLEIRGRITDESGKPVPHVKLSAYPSKSRPGRIFARFGRAIVESREDGSYRLDGLEAEEHEVTATLDDRLWSDTREVTPPAEGQDFVVTASASLEGLVVNGTTGRPVEQFRARLAQAQAGRSSSFPYTNGVSSKDGSFRIERVKAGLYDLTIEAEGFAPGVVQGLRLENGKPLRDVRVVLELGASVSGIVVDEQDAGVSGVRVGIVGSSGIQEMMSGMSESMSVVTVTDARGGFRIDGLAAGAINLAAKPEDSLATYLRVELRKGEQKEGIELRLQKGATIRGTVVWKDSGEPAWGAKVSVEAGSSEILSMAMGREGSDVDAQGQFVLTAVPTGHLTLRVLKPQTRQHVSKPIDVTGDMKGLEIELERTTGAIVGHVLDEDGKPIAETFVVTQGPDQNFAPGMTDDTGAFRINGLGTGKYRLITRFEGKSGKRTASREVDVKDGSETDVTLQPEMEDGATLSGTVRRSDGEAVAGLEITVSLDQGSATSLGTGRWSNVTKELDAAGGYRVTKLPPGRYQLVVSSARNQSDCGAEAVFQVQVVMTDQDMRQDIEIPPSGTVRGTVRARGGTPAAGTTVRISTQNRRDLCSAQTDRDGGYVLTGVAPGTTQLSASSEGYAEASVEVQVPRGGEVRQDVELRKSGALTGRVVDPNGDAVSQAWMQIRRGSGLPLRREHLVPDDQGRYEVLGLAEGEYELTARSVGFAPQTIGPVKAGGESSPEVNFKLSRGGTLRVQVKAKPEAVLAGQFVGIEQVFQGETWPLDRSAQTDETGTSEIALLEPGTYRVRLTSGDGASEPVEVEVEEGQVSEAQLTSKP